MTAMAMAMSMAAANYDAIAFGRAHATAVHESKEGCGGKEDAVHNDEGLVEGWLAAIQYSAERGRWDVQKQP